MPSFASSTESAAPRVDLDLLGSPRMRLPEGAVPLPADKRGALLAYLALDGAWVPRERLLLLFWPDSDAAGARTNLRQLLRRTRQLDHPGALEFDGDAIRYAAASDVATMRTALDAADDAAAVASYRGPLLDAFHPSAGAAFEAWLELERSTLQTGFRRAALRRAEALTSGDDADPAAAADLLRRLWEQDGYDEGALRGYLGAAAAAGEGGAALAAYRAFAARLARELDADPSPETAALAAEIAAGIAAGTDAGTDAGTEAGREGRAAPPTASAAAPPPGGRRRELVGRDDDAARIQTLLSERRALALTGLGGVGKSALAAALAERLAPQLAAGAAVARLGGLEPRGETEAGDALIAKIAEAVGLRLAGERPPRAQLEAFLADRELLLVIDELDAAMEAAPLLSELLAAAPQLRLLITSRVLPELPGVAALELRGLAQADAAALFLREAERHAPGYDPDAAERAAIDALCSAVGGLPLALELAAAWVRELSTAELAAEVAHSSERLERDGRRAHDSVNDVLEGSWARLAPEQQRVLARLAVFRGGALREVARAVAGASGYALLALQHRSLLQRDGSRLSLHPLVRAFAEARLEASGEAPEIRRRHADEIARLWEERWPLVGQGDEAGFVALMAPEMDDTVAMWSWCAGNRVRQPIAAIARTLVGFVGLNARYREGIALLRQAVAAFPEPDDLRAVLCARLGRLEVTQSGAAAARPWLEEALAIHEAGGTDPFEHAFTQMSLAAADRSEGDLAAAEAGFERCLELFEAQGNRRAVGQTLYNLGELALERGELAAARERYAAALAIAEAVGDRYASAHEQLRLGDVSAREGDPAAAAPRLAAAEEIFVALGQRAGLASLARIRAELAVAAGDAAQARALLRDALAIYRDLGHDRRVTEVQRALDALNGEASS